MNGDVNVGVIGQQAQVNVENAPTLALSEDIEQQVQASVQMCMHWLQVRILKSKCKLVLMVGKHLQKQFF
jgi:transcriptional regulator